MKKYELLDTPQNRTQHDLFLKQHKAKKDLDVRAADEEHYLNATKHMLTVEWITDVEFEEITTVTKEPEITMVIESKPKSKRKYNKNRTKK